MPGALADKLRQRIEQHGPIPFRDFMAAALYDPEHGYYTRPMHPTGLGPHSDYATSPTLHPFFAQAVAQEVAAVWDGLGRPGDFQVVEFGGGRGDLARDAVKWLDAAAHPLGRIVKWKHVEAGQALHLGDPRIRRVAAMPFVPHGVVLGHELLDAMPFDILEFDGRSLREVCVTWNGTRFVETTRPADPELSSAAEPRLAQVPGQRIVGYPFARQWFAKVAARLHRGSVLVMDYGERSNRLWNADHMDGTVRGFYDHGIVSDVLQEPGLVDITASVDFDLTRRWAEEAGLELQVDESQEDFLIRHGILDELNRIDRGTLQGASSYLRLRQLLLPSGLGGAFKVQRFGQ